MCPALKNFPKRCSAERQRETIITELQVFERMAIPWSSPSYSRYRGPVDRGQPPQGTRRVPTTIRCVSFSWILWIWLINWWKPQTEEALLQRHILPASASEMPPPGLRRCPLFYDNRGGSRSEKMNTLLLFLGMGISWSSPSTCSTRMSSSQTSWICSRWLTWLRWGKGWTFKFTARQKHFLGGCQEGQNKDRDKCGISFGPDNKRGIARQGF